MDKDQIILDRFSLKLKALRAARQREPNQFESDFLAGSPISEQSLRQVEVEHGVTLPVEYRAFLGRFGDTCAGPGNRFYHFREGLRKSSHEPFPLAQPFHGCNTKEYEYLPPEQQWEEYGKLLSLWETVPKDHGVILICAYGCAIDAYLIVNGPFAGKVWVQQGDIAYYGPFGNYELFHGGSRTAELQPTYPPKDYTFIQWYEHWLDAQLTLAR